MWRRLCLTWAAALMVTPALAHTGLGDASDFAHGFMHPVSGLDHVLAMVAVGVFATHLGGRALWLGPASFIFMMAVGGALGMADVSIPFVEIGIGLSIVVLGVAIALHVNVTLAVAMALVGFLAIFHGHAHGAEMPETMSGLAYGTGFVLATALLQAAGIVVGRIGQAQGRRVVQAGGVLMAAAGVMILAGFM